MAPALRSATLHFWMCGQVQFGFSFAESFVHFLENRDF